MGRKKYLMSKSIFSEFLSNNCHILSKLSRICFHQWFLFYYFIYYFIIIILSAFFSKMKRSHAKLSKFWRKRFNYNGFNNFAELFIRVQMNCSVFHYLPPPSARKVAYLYLLSKSSEMLDTASSLPFKYLNTNHFLFSQI